MHLLSLGLAQVVCSPLQRSRRHAKDLGLPVTVLEDLAEQAFGEWEGRPWADLQTEEAEAVAAFFEDPVHACPPGGESYAACAARAVGCLPALPPGPTLVLAHGGPLRALLAHHLGLDLPRSLDLAWEPFGLTRLDRYAEGRARLVFHNQAL
jgi:broad specificity phosphatase PhoE